MPSKDSLPLTPKQYRESHRSLLVQKAKLYYQKNREERLAYMSKKRASLGYKEYTKNLQLKRKYGISLDVYNALFADQKGLCLGCYRHQSQFINAFAVDHNHTTGRVRGLLCASCNLTIGRMNEDSNALRRLADYIEKHNV